VPDVTGRRCRTAPRRRALRACWERIDLRAKEATVPHSVITVGLLRQQREAAGGEARQRMPGRLATTVRTLGRRLRRRQG
jgi:hypothetical protein